MIKPIVKNPLLLMMSDSNNKVSCLVNEQEDIIEIPNGMFYENFIHFGFSIIKNQNGICSQKTYGTQCPILGYKYVEKDELTIYETNKSSSWKFDNEGNLIQKANFVKESERDRNYILDNMYIFVYEDKNLCCETESIEKQIDQIIEKANENNDFII